MIQKHKKKTLPLTKYEVREGAIPFIIKVQKKNLPYAKCGGGEGEGTRPCGPHRVGASSLVCRVPIPVRVVICRRAVRGDRRGSNAAKSRPMTD